MSLSLVRDRHTYASVSRIVGQRADDFAFYEDDFSQRTEELLPILDFASPRPLEGQILLRADLRRIAFIRPGPIVIHDESIAEDLFQVEITYASEDPDPILRIVTRLLLTQCERLAVNGFAQDALNIHSFWSAVLRSRGREGLIGEDRYSYRRERDWFYNDGLVHNMVRSFVIGHEIGHSLFPRLEGDEAEIQADAFARAVTCHLLMQYGHLDYTTSLLGFLRVAFGYLASLAFFRAVDDYYGLKAESITHALPHHWNELAETRYTPLWQQAPKSIRLHPEFVEQHSIPPANLDLQEETYRRKRHLQVVLFIRRIKHAAVFAGGVFDRLSAEGKITREPRHLPLNDLREHVRMLRAQEEIDYDEEDEINRTVVRMRRQEFFGQVINRFTERVLAGEVELDIDESLHGISAHSVQLVMDSKPKSLGSGKTRSKKQIRHGRR